MEAYGWVLRLPYGSVESRKKGDESLKAYAVVAAASSAGSVLINILLVLCGGYGVGCLD